MTFIYLWTVFTIGLIIWVTAKKYFTTTKNHLQDVDRYEAWRQHMSTKQVNNELNKD